MFGAEWETDLKTDQCNLVRETELTCCNTHSSHLPINWGFTVINIQIYSKNI